MTDRMVFCGGLRPFQKTQINQPAVVCCGGSAAVRGGSKKPNEIKVRRLCGAWGRETPYYPIRSAGPIEARGGRILWRSKVSS
jgi:hypothetical protein